MWLTKHLNICFANALQSKHMQRMQFNVARQFAFIHFVSLLITSIKKKVWTFRNFFSSPFQYTLSLQCFITWPAVPVVRACEAWLFAVFFMKLKHLESSTNEDVAIKSSETTAQNFVS